MLKLSAGSASQATGQCTYCGVRRTGLCNPFSDDAEMKASGLESAHLPVRVFSPGDDIYYQGEMTDLVYNVVSGWVFLHQDMGDGRRHVSQFLLAGALFGVKPRGLPMSHGATAITAASICAIPTTRLDGLRRSSPAFNEHFIWMLQRENHLALEAQTMFCQGASRERVARLLWGLAVRIAGPGAIAAGVALKAPISQRLIAEATGLTSIHVNRVFRRLREQRIVEFHDGVLIIEDPEKLAELADANPESAALWRDGAVEPRAQTIAKSGLATTARSFSGGRGPYVTQRVSG